MEKSDFTSGVKYVIFQILLAAWSAGNTSHTGLSCIASLPPDLMLVCTLGGFLLTGLVRRLDEVHIVSSTMTISV